VNGIWFSILNQRFPTNAMAWTISPEVRTGRDYTDLLITRNTYSPFVAHPTIILEGKRDRGSTWDNVGSRLQEYAQTYVRRNGQFIYVVAARGRECRFFRYRKGDVQEMTCMAYNAATQRVSYLDGGRATTLDISTDQAAISYFIDEIIAHPTPL
jgi:hypothetical protein